MLCEVNSSSSEAATEKVVKFIGYTNCGWMSYWSHDHWSFSLQGTCSPFGACLPSIKLFQISPPNRNSGYMEPFLKADDAVKAMHETKCPRSSYWFGHRRGLLTSGFDHLRVEPESYIII